MSENGIDVRDAAIVKPSAHDIEMVFGTWDSPKVAYSPDVHSIENENSNSRGKPNNNHDNGNYGETHSAQPLLEPDKEPPKPPLAGPEIDDLDGDSHTHTIHSLDPYPGIDDGLLEPVDDHHDHNGDDVNTEKREHDGSDEHHTHDDGAGIDDDSTNVLEPRYGNDDRPLSPIPSSPDVNSYQQKKNLAQGMMDLALLSANANQLRYVLEYTGSHPYYYPSIVFISLSIIIQIAVGVGLIMNSRYNVMKKKEEHKADKINDMTVLGVFLITIVNVFITSFSVASPAGGSVAAPPSNVQQAG